MIMTRRFCTAIAALSFMLLVTLFSSLGQRLGWCQEQKQYTAREMACIDSGLTPDCKVPPGGVGTWKGQPGARNAVPSVRAEPRGQDVPGKPASRSKMQIHKK